MTGRLMEHEDFEGTFADELEMMRDIEQESQQGRANTRAADSAWL